ncbi:unnamed protein product [Gongylonema pulchrum]|uniref:Transposase n=1 Tax=Gongylonema pulchrum TaxID=637853 RepID=A0A183CZP7_9BILA|nr:unnamed protein product [Gongylonema pulchrum]
MILTDFRFRVLPFVNRYVAFFQVGHHIIEGKEVKLENPFVVLRKNEQGSNVVPIMAVIRKKLLFRTRPKPI